MVNFLHKKEWNNTEWSIFFSNLDLLRNKYGLKKGEFSRKLKITNAYRTDRKSASKKAIDAVCSTFNVTEDWLSTDHTSENIAVSEKVTVAVGESQTEFDSDATHYDPDELQKLLAKIDTVGDKEVKNTMSRFVKLLERLVSAYEEKQKADNEISDLMNRLKMSQKILKD